MSYLGQKLPEGRIHVLFIIIASISPGTVPCTKWMLNNFLLNWSSLKNLSSRLNWEHEMFLQGCRSCCRLRALWGRVSMHTKPIHFFVFPEQLIFLIFPPFSSFLFPPSWTELPSFAFSLLYIQHSLLGQGQEGVPGSSGASPVASLLSVRLSLECNTDLLSLQGRMSPVWCQEEMGQYKQWKFL